jgi:F-type H+-transporting ATPase subunit b
MISLAFAESIQLVPDGTLFLHIAIIITMVFILNRLLFRPINQTLEERETHTRGRSGEARDILQQVEESLRSYEISLRQARADGYRLMEQQESEASEGRKSKIVLVRKEIDEQIEGQKLAIQAQVNEARATLEDEAKQVAAGINRQILGR